MKKTILISSVLLLLPSCVQPYPVPRAQPIPHGMPVAVAQRSYIALPGQEVVRVRPSDTDAAFDQQVAAYQNGSAPQQLPVTQPVANAYPTQPAADNYPTQQPGPVVITQPQQTNMYPVDGQTTANMNAPVGGAMANPASTGSMDYTVKITNNTNGRIFVEAQDAAGEIYPCGFMWGGKSYSTTKEKSAPIKGPITVVVRDPDQPGAPELRRYQIDPPANYNNKTIGINIISGGIYQVTLDGKEHFISGTPAPAPATTPAPIPEPTAAKPEAAPAGI